MTHLTQGFIKPFPSGGGRFQIIFLVAGLIILSLLAGCVTAPVIPPHTPKGILLFPPPPETARVQYLGWLNGPQDLPSQQGHFSEFIFGSEPVRLPLVKPINTVLVGPKLYICDTIQNTILVYDLEKGGVRLFAGDNGTGKIKQPNNITVDDAGRFYVPDKERGAVLVYNPDESFLGAWGRPGEVQPVAVAVDAAHLYVCDVKDHEIEVWSRTDGTYQRSIGKSGGGEGEFFLPTYIALDKQGMLYVTDTGNSRVQKLTPDGKFLLQFGKHGDALGNFALPKGMDVDSKGRLYVVDARFPNVQMFSPEGKLLLFFGDKGSQEAALDLPAGLKVYPWPSITWFTEKVAPGFDPEFLVIVVDQAAGKAKIHFFAVASETHSAGEPGKAP